MSRTLHAQRAFTLIELLVVISIIAVLAAMLLPAIKLVRESAQASSCRSSLRQLALGIENYGLNNDGMLPPSATVATSHPWFTLIAPDIELPDVYAQYPASSSQACTALRDLTGSNTIWGCPRWKRTSTTSPYYPGLGYTMRPGLAGDINHNNMYSVSGRMFARASITQPTRRIMLGDAGDFILNVSGATATSWFATAGDPVRHGTRANYAFFDGHAATIAASQSPWLGVANPASTAWSP